MTPETRASELLQNWPGIVRDYPSFELALRAALQDAYLAGFNDGLDEARETGERLDLGEVY
jgi:hypothetical protein